MRIKILILTVLTTILILNSSYVLAIDRTIHVIGADVLHRSGVQGDDMTICIVDTGFDYTHPNLAGCTENEFLNENCERFIGGYDFGDNDSNPIVYIDDNFEDFQHGTWVAGICSSDHSRYKGVAPKSKIVGIKVLSSNVNLTYDEIYTNIKKGIKWCLDNQNKYNISVISLSLGVPLDPYDPSDLGYDESTCPDEIGIQAYLNSAVNNDIFIAIASGNEYKTTGIRDPACLKNATAVGSTTSWLFGELLSGFTNRGEALDLLAPGGWISTTNVGGWFITGDEVISGTSFATPHIAGAALLLKQTDSALKPHDIEILLKGTGDDIEDPKTGATYRRINLLNALHVLDWPTFHHDYRRTGFTLLKGDIDDANEAEEKGYLLSADYWDDVVTRPSIGDLDNDGKQEVVIVLANSTGNTGRVMSLQKKGWTEIFNENYKEKWVTVLEKESYWPPTIGDIEDGDDQKEVAVSLWNGTLLVLDGENGEIEINYGVESKYSIYKSTWAKGLIGNAVIADLDYDGDKEIVFADYRWGDIVYDWPGDLYVIDKNGNLIDNATFGNGGAQGAISVANIDDDDNLEIVVPSWYGVYVYDFNGNSLTEKWHTDDGLIEGSVVVYDIDKDNEYELIYVTNNESCSEFKTCYNKLYIRDAKTKNNEYNSPIAFNGYPRITPAVGDVDNDNYAEIVIMKRWHTYDTQGSIYAFEYDVTSSSDWIWSYSQVFGVALPTISPDIVDINGDGTNDVIFSIKDSNQIVAIDGSDGSELFTYKFDGEIGSAFAIGDIRDKGVADIAVKHAGSPVSWFSSLTGINEKPHLNTISNITTIEGELIDLNASGEVWATDEDNNTLNITYSSPFNSSGLWQTTVNDSGNYSILVEVSDGNLSDYQYVDVIVFESNTHFQNNFSDGFSFKTFNYSGTQNKSSTIRLPKNVTILYAQLKAEGFAP